MPGPPPPPPLAPPSMGPPPPPFFASSPSKSSGDNRGALLNSIKQGKKLRKAVTNDRSAPLVSGGVKPSPNSTNASTGGGFSSKPSVPNGLGGLFSEGMPKLRPTANRGDGIKSNNGGFSSLNSVNNSRNTNTNSNGGSSLPHMPPPKTFNNFHNEVQSALKKQMASDSNRSRGPPPPAPTRNISQSIENFQNSEKHSYRSKISNTNGLHLNVNNLHKSFANIPSPTSTPPTPKSFNSLQVNSSTLHRKANSSANLTVFESSEISNNGFPSRPSSRKPHLAPKPPVLNGKPAPPVKRVINRAHSMRIPRSPSPQSPEDSTYPTKFGTVRNMTSMLDKAHHRSRPTLNGRPHQNPPPPPNKIVKPPNHAPPPPPNVIPQPPSHAPPPPPPTRTNSQFNQPHLPLRASPSIPPNSTAPPPPPRHLSMRDMLNNKRVPHIDLDAKFRSEFRPIHQFPPPGVYRGLLKAYTSRTVGNKQQAPLPPNHIQISNRMWDSSTC